MPRLPFASASHVMYRRSGAAVRLAKCIHCPFPRRSANSATLTSFRVEGAHLSGGQDPPSPQARNLLDIAPFWTPRRRASALTESHPSPETRQQGPPLSNPLALVHSDRRGRNGASNSPSHMPNPSPVRPGIESILPCPPPRSGTVNSRAFDIWSSLAREARSDVTSKWSCLTDIGLSAHRDRLLLRSSGSRHRQPLRSDLPSEKAPLDRRARRGAPRCRRCSSCSRSPGR